MDYSRKLQSESRKAKLTPVERAMADLMCLGWSASDAFIATGQLKPALNDEYNKTQIEKVISDDPFIKYMEQKQRSIKRGILKQYTEEPEESEKEDITLLSKEEILQEALRSAYALPINDPKRVEILMKYADLQQMKKDEVKEEDTTVHYYLPLTCNNCELYIKHKKQLKK
mgnify:CR=1 FL=1|jgi:hypothetical protein|nr:MAG TPA: hypothetical protein [Caudoviricetes sp.]